MYVKSIIPQVLDCVAVKSLTSLAGGRQGPPPPPPLPGQVVP